MIFFTRLITLFLAFFVVKNSFSQQQMCFQNPSCEGPSQAHVVPAPWQACYGSPDTQPGQWGITLPPSNGNSYVSFLHAGNSANGYSEGMTQLLTPCMVANQVYTFTVDLAHSNIYNTASPGNCYSSLAIWGGNSACARTQLLWTSGVIWNTTWQTYTVTFTPTSNWCYIAFEPYYITPCSGYINVLLDNISCIVPQSTVTGTNVTCFGACNGTSTANPTSGTPPFTYLWTPGNSTTQTITGLCAGTYSCVVTDATGQTSSGSYTVTQPTQLVANTNNTNLLCFGQCNATASVTASGGTPGYTYLWSPGGQTTASVSGQCAGSYTVTVTDANGCTQQQVVTITQPPQLTSTIVGNNVLCFGGNSGSATVTANGGTGPYSYNWTPSGGNNATANNLTAGNYTCTVTDANGCTSAASITITQPTLLSMTSSGFAATCNGACDGQGICIPSGGTQPYNYQWSPTGGNMPSTTGLCANTYTITVTDANGCTTSNTVVVTEPTAIVLNTSSVQSTCNLPNGSATVTPSGGTPNYTQLWTPGNQTTTTATNLMAGTYTVTVTDANGCTATTTVVVGGANAVSSSIQTSTNVSCNGGCNGSATATITGGTGPFNYLWSSGGTALTENNLCAGTYTFTVTDANNCTFQSTVTITQPTALTITSSAAQTICLGGSVNINSNANGGTTPYNYVWSNGATTSNISVSPTATTTYSVVVTDANGCTSTVSSTVTVNPLPVVSFTANDQSGCAPLCVTFNCPTPNIVNYVWNFGDQSAGTGNNAQHCYSVPGTYSVSLAVTDNNGCSNTLTAPNMINVYPVPTAGFTASNNPTTILDPVVTVTTICSNCDSALYNFGDIANGSLSTGANGTVSYTYSDTGTYTITQIVWNQYGCYDTISITVVVEPDVTLFVPSSFTPNGDGTNDIFIPKGTYINPDDYEMWIFDRWGNLIFHTQKLSTGWDGRANGGSDIAQQDVYVWKIKAKDFKERKREYIGHVTLIK